MSNWGYPGYPPHWDTDDDEVQPVRQGCFKHEWIETGTKKSWCKYCDKKAIWTIDGWVEI